jgi:hypothetical protein
MSAFSDTLTSDLASVFLNFDEFAEPHQINGASGVACILDVPTNEPMVKKGYSRYEGFGKSTITLFIRESDLPDSGSVLSRKLISVDKADYRILDSISNVGLYELTLEAVK